jgi:hypothetical protein
LGKAEVVRDGIVFWSNKTAELWFWQGNKIRIDNHSYIVRYNLDEGWIIIKTDFPEVVAICDPFSGNWFKTFIKKGENNITIPFKVKSYGGLKLLIISSPWGFGFIKEKEQPLSFWDYPIVILKSELAKFGWQRAFYSACLFVTGLALARYLKKDKMVVNFGKHLIVIVFVCIMILAVLGMTYTTDTVKINETVKHVPHLVFSTYRMKDMYNYYFMAFFIAGYILGYLLWGYNRLYVVIVGYNTPVKLNIYPYDKEKQLIRDFDGKLAVIKFKNDLRQFITLNINGFDVQGILAVGVKELNNNSNEVLDLDEKTGKIVVRNSKQFNIKYGLITFFGFLAISIVGDYLNVFRIDLAYTLLFAILTALATNINAIKSWLGLEVEKTIEFECSRLMTEDNYVRMLKDAEIEHLTKEYDNLFVEFAKLGTIAKARAVKLLSSAGRIVRAEIERLKKEINESEEDGRGG